nr:MAG: wsv137-like protein [Metapenaeopsis lamellata majanivirus]
MDKSSLTTENLSNFGVSLLNLLNFLSTYTGSKIFQNFLLAGVYNKEDKRLLWKMFLSQTYIKVGLTFINDGKGTIEAVEARSSEEYNSMNNKKTLLRVFQTIINIIRMNSDIEGNINENNDDGNKFNIKELKPVSVKFPKTLNPTNADTITSILLNDMYDRKDNKPTTVWFTFSDIYIKEYDDLTIKNNFLKEVIYTDSSKPKVATFNGRSINEFEYNKADIEAIMIFFSSSTHKVHCYKHDDKRPSMTLYLKREFWINVTDKHNPSIKEIHDLRMAEAKATDSNITTFRNFNVILFIVSAHCFACNYHEQFMSKSQLRCCLSDYYI